MFGKLFLTLAVILIGVLVFRHRQQNRLPPADPRVVETIEPKTPMTPIRMAAYGIVAALVLSSGIWFYQSWKESHEVVNVRVINTQSGLFEEYQAERGRIRGRRFETIDGRVIRAAEVERIEIMDERL